VLAGLLGQGGPHRPATLPAGATPKAAAVTIEVSGKSLIGQPVSAVVARLHKLGLKVRVRWQVTGHEPPGRVVSVQPGGLLPPGRLVTVTGAVRPAGSAPGHVRPPARPAAPARRAPGTSPPATSAPPAAPAPSSSGSPGTPPPAASGSPAPPDPTGGGSAPPSPAPQGSSPAADPPGVLALR
jgi:beta-lactam-binding protein with PASTA domain